MCRGSLRNFKISAGSSDAGCECLYPLISIIAYKSKRSEYCLRGTANLALWEQVVVEY